MEPQKVPRCPVDEAPSSSFHPSSGCISGKSVLSGSSVSAPSECSDEFSSQRNLKMSLSAAAHGGSARKGEKKGLIARGDSILFLF